MRIVIDLQACQNGSRHRGIGRYAMAMTKALIRMDRGHEFRIVLTDAFPGTILDIRRELEGLIPQEHILLFSLPGRTSSADTANTWRTKAAEILRSRFVAGLAPDLLFVPSLFEGYWDRTVVSIEPASYPVAVTLYDLIPLEYPNQHLPGESDRARYFHKISNVKQADLLLAISDFIAGEATDRLGVEPERVISTPLGVDEWFRVPADGEIDRAALMRRYGITRPFVLNTSPLEFRKNIEGLIAGFASMHGNVRNRHQLVIVGNMNGDAYRYVAEIASAEGLASDAVVLAGFVPDDDLVALYSQCELFAFPSLSEGFGLPVLEAMACGAPVVGSSTTSIPEVIGRDDLLFDPLDASAMGRVMERILVDPALQAELRVFGPRRAAGFSWEAAATTAMLVFERLHAARTPSLEGTDSSSDPADRRVRIAFVASTMAPQHGQTSQNIAMVTGLARHYDLVLICPDGSIGDPWTQGVFETHDFGWFAAHAAGMEHIVYASDIGASEALMELMKQHPGLLILQDSLGNSDDRDLQDLERATQDALFEAHGYAGLIDALSETVTTPAQHRALLAERLRQYATATLVQSERGAVASKDPLLPLLPVTRATDAADAFRSEYGIPADAKLIAGFVTDEKSAAGLIAAFRSSRTAQDAHGHLVVHVVGPKPFAKPVTAMRMFGNIHHLARLDPHYRGLMSAADISVVAGDLEVWLKDRIVRDAASCNQLSVVSDAEQSSTALEEAIDAGCVDIAIRSKQKDEAVQLPPSIPAGMIRVVEAALCVQPRADTLTARKKLAELLPASVRGVRPDAHDLADVAIAISRNEAHNRISAIYCDISAFASSGATRRLDPISKAFLVAVLQRGGQHIRAVYAQGGRFIVAGNYVRTLIGLDQRDFQDILVDIRPGDRIIGFDILAAFQAPVLDGLLNAVERGAVLAYSVVGYLPLERNDLLAEIIDLALSWGRSRPASLQSHIAPLDAVANRAAGNPPSAAAATIERLIANGVPVDVLVADHKPVYLSLAPARAQSGAPIVPMALPPSVATAADALETALARPAHPEAVGALDGLNYAITGHLLGNYSLAIINRGLARTLERAYPGQVRYLPVETVPIDHTEGVPADEKAEMIALSARRAPADGNEIVISHHYPLLLPDGDYRLAFALFFGEESHVPEKTVRRLEKGFDAIISPTRSVTNALVDSGLRIPVATIGQPVDIAAYTAIAGTRRSDRGTTTFLHVSSCFKRKGVDILLAAWARAFDDQHDVRLVIKTFPNPHNDVEEQVAELRVKHPHLATIEIVNRDVEREAMPGFYAAADVMVLPSRGEGYNLPALEAMAAGLPLVVTGHGGHRDFCGPDQARMITYRFTPTESHVGGGHSMWVEPDVDDLVRALQEFLDPAHMPVIQERRRRAIAAAAIESDEGSWLRRNAAMISTMLSAPIGGPPRTAWVSTWDVQCGIAQYSDYLLGNMSAAARERTVILCDERTLPQRGTGIAYDPIWVAGAAPKADVLAKGVERYDAEAVVIQHQDGLISWEQIGRIGRHPQLADTVKIVILHNARNLHRVGGDELPMVLQGLARMDRLLVHNIGDVNFLLNYGLTKNVGLLPHGAFAPPRAPWPRALDRDDDPIIGCHGFFFRHKGIDKLIRAAALLRREWPRLRLRLVNARFPGGAHDAIIAECQALAVELGMADAIEWHFDFLPVTRIDELLSQCDLLALPYDESDDSASGAVRVSLSSMVPFIATRVKIFAELGDAAAWADSNEPHVLAETIAPLLRSPEKRRAVQAAMHEWLVAHDWKHVAGTLEGMIEGLVKQKRLGWATMER